MERLARSHPEWKRLRALRQDRAARDAEGVLVAEGIHLVQEALASGAVLERAVVAPRLDRTAEGRALLARLREAGVPLLSAEAAAFDRLQDARSPQPVLAVVRRPPSGLDLLPGRSSPALVVVAAGVQDPGNLGAILRSADAAGATAFVALHGGADLYHPRAVRASMGSVFRLPCAVAPGADEALEALAGLGIRRLGTSPTAELLYDLYDLREPVALFFGPEGSGLGALSSRLDAAVRIPMHPGVESLSVGAAAAVLLYEAARQRRA